MTASSSSGKIFAAIIAVKRELPAIAKRHETTSGPKYKFRSADDVINACGPLFDKHGIITAVYVERSSREIRAINNKDWVFVALEMVVTFYAEDGSFLTVRVVGEAGDNSDKASTKAQTVGYRIACCTLLSIETDETTIDPEAGEQPPSIPVRSVDRALTQLRKITRTEDLKKFIQYARRCAAGEGKPGDVLTAADVTEVHQECIAVAKRLRIHDEGVAWINSVFSEITEKFSAETPEADPEELEQQRTSVEDVAGMLSQVANYGEEALRDLIRILPGVVAEDVPKVVSMLRNADYPPASILADIESATTPETLAGERRSVTSAEAAGLIETVTKTSMVSRIQARLAQLQKGSASK